MRDLEVRLEGAREVERLELRELLRVADGMEQRLDSAPSWSEHRSRYGSSRPYVLGPWRTYLRQYGVWLEAVRARQELEEAVELDRQIGERADQAHSERYPDLDQVLDELGRKV